MIIGLYTLLFQPLHAQDSATNTELVNRGKYAITATETIENQQNNTSLIVARARSFPFHTRDAQKNSNTRQVTDHAVFFGVRNDSLKSIRANQIYVTDRVRETKNYNFTTRGANYAEQEWYGASTTAFDVNPDDINLKLKQEVRNFAWSVPGYDDFVIQELTITSIDADTIFNFHIKYLWPAHGPWGKWALDNQTLRPFMWDQEYIWDEKRGFFITFDESVKAPDGGTPGYQNTGLLTQDVGDPGDALEANSIDFQLYSPQAWAGIFVDVPAPEGGKLEKVEYAIGHRYQIQFQAYHPNSPIGEQLQFTDWDGALVNLPDPNDMRAPIPQFLKNPQPKMSWREANQQFNNDFAGNLWERLPAQVAVIGPYTLAPGESISYKVVWIAPAHWNR